MRQTLAEIAGRDSRAYPDNHSGTTSVHTHRSEEQLRETVLGVSPMPPSGGFCASRGSTTAQPLVQFFPAQSWRGVGCIHRSLERASELIIDGKTEGTASVADEETERLESLRKPFLSLLAKRRRKAERGFADKDCITTGNSPRFRSKYPFRL